MPLYNRRPPRAHSSIKATVQKDRFRYDGSLIFKDKTVPRVIKPSWRDKELTSGLWELILASRYTVCDKWSSFWKWGRDTRIMKQT